MIEKFINKIHLGKCDDILLTIPDSSVDIVITSPPYNIDLGNNKFKRDSYDRYNDNLPYNEYLEWMEKIFRECYRILKSGGRICLNVGDGKNGKIPTHADFIVQLRDKIGFLMMATIIWNKNHSINRCSWGSYCSPLNPSFPCTFEYIIVMSKETYEHKGDKKNIDVFPKEFQTNSLAMWTFNPEYRMLKKYGHPAVFPKELPRRLMKQLSYKNDIVLDPFSGTGTTCVVAKELERRFIGIEVSEKYHKISLNRIDNTMSPELFK